MHVSVCVCVSVCRRYIPGVLLTISVTMWAYKCIVMVPPQFGQKSPTRALGGVAGCSIAYHYF